METPAPIAAPSRFLTISQLVVSILGVLLSLGALLANIILLLSPAVSGQAGADTSQLLNLLFVILAVILLSIPSVVTSIRALAGLPAKRGFPRRFFVASLMLLLVPFIILLDSRHTSDLYATPLSAITNVFTILIPIWWFLELGRWRLNGASAKRQWGFFTFSTYITLPVIMVVELLVLAFGFLFGFLWIVQQPGFQQIMIQIGDQIAFDPALLQDLFTELTPLLLRPGVIIALIVVMTLVIPMIEELLKPLAVWAMHKRNLTPAEGFTLGLICGASFALLESLFSISAVMPGDRLFVMTGRLGTGLLHILTAGLSGWSLTATWRDGKNMRVVVIYVINVIIHGVWNFFALLMGLSTVGDALPQVVSPDLSGAAAWVLLALAGFLLVILVGFNIYLRRTITPPKLNEISENSMG